MIVRFICAAFLGLSVACSTVTVRYPNDPAGGALTESVGCVYDFDHDGFWYVVFVRADGLLNAVHRHDPGIHLFVDRGDLLFYVRCSGRKEVIDLQGETFNLSKGTVFLCNVEGGHALVEQLAFAPIACHGEDAESRSKALAQLSVDPRVSAFLSPEAKARILAQWRIGQEKEKKKETH